MFIAVIEDAYGTEVLSEETEQELQKAIEDYVETNLNLGDDALTVQFYEPSVKKTVKIDYIWTVEGETKAKPLPKNARAALDI